MPRDAIDPSTTVRGRLLVASAAVLWSTSGFFAKAPLFSGWPGPVLAFWRAFFAALLLLPLARQRRWSWKLLPMALTFAAMNYTYLTAMVETEATLAIWLQSTAPLWVFLATVLVLRESPQPGDRLLLAVGGAGIGLILFFELQGAAPTGVLMGLLSGIFYGGVVLSLRMLRSYDAAWLIALNHVTTAILLAPSMAMAGQEGIWPQGWQWLFLAGFGMLQMGLPYVLFARGLRHLPAYEASGLGLLEPILVPLWVYVAWHHAASYTPPRWWTLAGGGLIMLGLFGRYVAQARKYRQVQARSGEPA